MSCSPVTAWCPPAHFSLLIHDAMASKFQGSVALSLDAEKLLLQHGHDHKDAFDAALKAGRSSAAALSEQLQNRLGEALQASPAKDSNGILYNPPAITADALRATLAEKPWLP